MTNEEFQRLIAERGGLAGPPVVVDPEIDNPDPIDAKLPGRAKVPNPNPRYKYIFNNGTQLEARDASDPSSPGVTDLQITDAGTALKPTAGASPTSQLDKLDARGNIILPGDTTTVVAKLRDPASGQVTDMPDPKSDPNGTLKDFGDQLLLVKPDGTYTVVVSKTAADKAPTLHTGPKGELIEYDPSKPAGSRITVAVAAPADKTKPTTEVRNGKTFQWDPATNTWVEAPGLPSEKKPATASVNTTAKYIIYYDDQGNEVSRNENPNYEPPKPTQLTPDSVSPNIPLLKPDGTIQWVPNQNRVMASQAMQDLLGQVGLKVNGGELSMADAKDLLTGTVNAMNAQTAQLNAQTAQQTAGTQAATGALTALGQGAQTGAGILQNRVSNAQQMLGSILGVAGQGQRSGNMGGGLMSAPAGLGEALVGGIQGWTTQLGGGQAVYDTAARLVQQADPSNSPMAQTAYGVLSQMLERYHQTTGEPHPLVAATQAAQQSQQQNAFVPTPQQPDWNLVTGPQNMQTTPALAPGVAGTVQPGDPRYVGTLPTTGFTAPNPYASGGLGPVVAGYTAPRTVAL